MIEMLDLSGVRGSRRDMCCVEHLGMLSGSEKLVKSENKSEKSCRQEYSCTHLCCCNIRTIVTAHANRVVLLHRCPGRYRNNENGNISGRLPCVKGKGSRGKEAGQAKMGLPTSGFYVAIVNMYVKSPGNLSTSCFVVSHI